MVNHPNLDRCGKLVRSSIRIDTEQDLTSLHDPVSFFIFHESYNDRHIIYCRRQVVGLEGEVQLIYRSGATAKFDVNHDTSYYTEILS